MIKQLALPKPDDRLSSLESQVGEQGEVIQSLFDAFRTLVEENVKKEAKIERLEQAEAELKQFVFLNLLDGMGQIRDKVASLGGLDDVRTELEAVRAGLADAQFAAQGKSAPLQIGGNSNNDQSSLPSAIQHSLDAVLSAVEFVGKQRSADVQATNAALERLDLRIRQVEVQDRFPPGESSEESSAVEDRIAQVSAEWTAKWASVVKTTSAQLLQGSRGLEGAKKSFEKTNLTLTELGNRVSKFDTELAFLAEEIRRVDSQHAAVYGLESKLELGRAECKAQWERIARTSKQDMDGLRIKVERISILRDEFDRLSHELKLVRDSLWHPAAAERPTGSFEKMMPSLLASTKPPPVSTFHHPPSLLSDSSLLSFVDEGIGTAMPLRLTQTASILVPSGGAQMGSLFLDGGARVAWRIENVAAIIREPNRFPKILLSPEFACGTNLTARMKLFPQGSDQSRIDGCCSFYLRCLPGVVVRFAVDLAGEVAETFECEFEKQRDKGKHDFVRLNEFVEPDGSLTIGLEIRDVQPMSLA